MFRLLIFFNIYLHINLFTTDTVSKHKVYNVLGDEFNEYINGRGDTLVNDSGYVYLNYKNSIKCVKLYGN